MRRANRSGPRLFFIEFLIVLFFFLIISTVCLRLFAGARQITQKAGALSDAQTFAAAVAEAIEAGDGSAMSLQSVFPDGQDASGTESSTVFCLYFDQDFHSCAEKRASYTLTAVIAVENRWKTGAVTVAAKDGTTVYELPFSFYRISTREEALL